MEPMKFYDACMELHRAGDIDAAIADLTQLSETQPDFALAHNALAAIWKKRGDLGKAVRYAEKYCELEPDDAFGYTVLSSFCIEAGEREKAEDALGKSHDLRFREQFAH
ncbi:MAG TPA: hypothetical protein DEB39_06730 [Planctomycetaceae bacterium]|nr:hypothetical protein [Planctomycetaceae bacterium]